MDSAGSIHDFAGAIFAGAFAAAAAAYTAGVAGPRASRRQGERDAAAAALPALAPWQLVSDEDLACVERCRATLARVARPIYSDFLVAAVLAYEDEHGTTRFVDGCNTETAVLPSSICAERCALLQLRLKAPRFRALKGVYISTFSGTDERALAEGAAAAAAGLPPPRTGYAPVLITPGLLCREMLSGFPAVDGGLRVFLFTHDWAPAGDSSTGRHSSRDDARGELCALAAEGGGLWPAALVGPAWIALSRRGGGLRNTTPCAQHDTPRVLHQPPPHNTHTPACRPPRGVPHGRPVPATAPVQRRAAGVAAGARGGADV
jgi:hypothetical protein